MNPIQKQFFLVVQQNGFNLIFVNKIGYTLDRKFLLIKACSP